MRRFVPEICGVECRSLEKGGPKFYVCCALNVGENRPEIFEGICKSTSLTTYWPSLV